MAELFDIYDEAGNCVGLAPRSECHGNPALIHRAVRIMIRHSDGRFLLQKRSMKKDIQPGKWDAAVGGHLDPGEDYLAAARRELGEELGVTAPLALTFLFDIQVRSDFESEDVQTYEAVYEGPFVLQESEVDEVRFWTMDEMMELDSRGEVTRLLSRELKLLRDMV